MEEIVSNTFKTSQNQSANVQATVMEEVNEVLELNLWEDSHVDAMRSTFAKNFVRCQPRSESNHLPEISADYEDRINFVSKFYQWIPEKPDVLRKFKKNNGVSKALREKANAYYEKGNMQRAAMLLNAAIMFAEPAGEELGRAFADRSDVLMAQQNPDPEGALKNIELAIKHNYPENKMQELEERRNKCAKMLKEFERKYLTHDNKADMASRRGYKYDLLKLNKPNPLIPCAESFVSIGNAQDVGRQLVVNKNVAAGTVVIVEQPFTTVNQGLLKFEANHCDHCYKFVKSGIPCQQCVFVMYCSEECRSNAEFGHHKFECSSLSYLYLDYANPYALMAFRIVCKVGPTELKRLFTTKDPNYFDLKKPYGAEANCKYESDSYLSIHHLVSHSSRLDKNSRYDNALSALRLMSVLEAGSEFFQIPLGKKKNAFKNFVAAILLRLQEALPYNGVALEALKAFQGYSLAQSYRLKGDDGSIEHLFDVSEGEFFDKSMIGIYSLGSLMNHSCDPSAVRAFDVVDRTMAIITTRALKVGDLLTVSYGKGYASSNLMERKLYLQSYHFECNCIACKNNWPAYSLLETKYEEPKNMCPYCSKTHGYNRELTGSRLTCGHCRQSNKREKWDEDYTTALRKYSQASKDLNICRPVQVLKAYKEFFPNFQFRILPPHLLLPASRILFDKALAFIFHCSD